jgi:hypothetical protein
MGDINYACNTQENQACGTSNCLPNITSYSTQFPHLEDLGSLFPLLGSFAESYYNTYASKGAPETPNPPLTLNSKPLQQDKLLVLALDYISTSLNTLKDLQPLYSQPMFSPQLYSNCYTAPNDCNEYPDLNALSIVSDFDLLPDILDFDQFHE